MARDPTEFIRSLRAHTDRGAALFYASNPHSLLTETIKSKMVVDDKDVLGLMFGDMGPLGSFAAQIRLAYLMGIVPKEAHDELIVITKIRNAFAHREDARDFSSPVIVKLCDKLTFSDEEEVTLPDDEIKRMMFERALEIAVKFSPPQGHPSSKFVQSCIWLALMLIAPGEIKRTIERADAEREKSSLEDDAGQSGADGSPE